MNILLSEWDRSLASTSMFEVENRRHITLLWTAIGEAQLASRGWRCMGRRVEVHGKEVEVHGEEGGGAWEEGGGAWEGGGGAWGGGC